MTDRPYRAIVRHYEDCLATHETGARAVDWKSERDADIRYDVMLDLLRAPPPQSTLLDFGCGLAELRNRLRERYGDGVRYTGLEVSEAFAAAARAHHRDADILCMDVLAEDADLPGFDYIVMNGIFTRRQDLSVAEMHAYLERLLRVLFARTRVGLAFNVMSKAVDFESDALFHPEPGKLLAFVTRHLTRHYVLRNDYGLYETTLYLYREPSAGWVGASREDDG